MGSCLEVKISSSELSFIPSQPKLLTEKKYTKFVLDFSNSKKD